MVFVVDHRPGDRALAEDRDRLGPGCAAEGRHLLGQLLALAPDEAAPRDGLRDPVRGVADLERQLAARRASSAAWSAARAIRRAASAERPSARARSPLAASRAFSAAATFTGSGPGGGGAGAVGAGAAGRRLRRLVRRVARFGRPALRGRRGAGAAGDGRRRSSRSPACPASRPNWTWAVTARIATATLASSMQARRRMRPPTELGPTDGREGSDPPPGTWLGPVSSRADFASL